MLSTGATQLREGQTLQGMAQSKSQGRGKWARDLAWSGMGWIWQDEVGQSKHR